jgi:hypothetical protein
MVVKHPPIIGIYEDSEKTIITWHMAGAVTDHATLCGIDGDDPVCGQYGVVYGGIYQKIDCVQCKTIWDRAMQYKAKNFKPQF